MFKREEIVIKIFHGDVFEKIKYIPDENFDRNEYQSYVNLLKEYGFGGVENRK